MGHGLDANKRLCVPLLLLCVLRHWRSARISFVQWCSFLCLLFSLQGMSSGLRDEESSLSDLQIVNPSVQSVSEHQVMKFPTFVHECDFLVCARFISSSLLLSLSFLELITQSRISCTKFYQTCRKVCTLSTRLTDSLSQSRKIGAHTSKGK